MSIKWQDTGAAARQLLEEQMQENAVNPDQFFSDPYVHYVWLVLDTKDKRAFIVYLADDDFEEIEYIGENWIDYLERKYK